MKSRGSPALVLHRRRPVKSKDMSAIIREVGNRKLKLKLRMKMKNVIRKRKCKSGSLVIYQLRLCSNDKCNC